MCSETLATADTLFCRRHGSESLTAASCGLVLSHSLTGRDHTPLRSTASISTDLKARGTTQAGAAGEFIDAYVYSTNDCVDPMRFDPAASPISRFSTVFSSDTAARNQRAAGGHAS